MTPLHRWTLHYLDWWALALRAAGTLIPRFPHPLEDDDDR